MIDWTKTIFHTCQEHLDWALAEKERLDNVPVPEGKIVFLGSNPSCTSPYEDPFSHCKSANKIINEWIPALGLTRDRVHFMNVANYKTPGNRPLKKSEIAFEVRRLTVFLMNQTVITLGQSAATAMNMVCNNYCLASETIFKAMPKVIEMPHPSGRNRLLNNRAWVTAMLDSRKAQLEASLTFGGNQ